jgi:N-acetylglutamate synthase-like GNAT family acetyltransferase
MIDSASRRISVAITHGCSRTDAGSAAAPMALSSILHRVSQDSVSIRPATATDQGAIAGLIREVRLNPRDLDWRRFVVADDAETLVGCAQVRVHARGTHELASVAVTADRRGSGIGGRLVEAVLARELDDTYLMTRRETASYFERFGFRRIAPAEAPSDFRRQFRIGQVFTTIISPLARRWIRIVPMLRRPERS